MALLRALGRLADHWLPRACALCDRTLAPLERGFCTPCAADLPGARTPRCEACGIGQDGRFACCADCRTRPPPWDRTIVLADYAPPLDRLVVALKFQGELAAAGPLGGLLGQALRRAGAPRVDALVPVPLGPGRLAERGYDQAAAIARSAGRAAGLPVRGAWLARIRDTPAQSRLPLQAREGNLTGAFRAGPGVAGSRVALVDDVMTSGSTLREAARALRAAGAQMVINLVVARTP